MTRTNSEVAGSADALIERRQTIEATNGSVMSLLSCVATLMRY